MNQTFEAVIIAGIAAFVLNVIVSPVASYISQRMTGKKLDAFDRKRENARRERDAERAIVLAIARTMLLDNYEKCMAKGSYTVEEREVYGKLYVAYKEDGGNGVISTVAERIRKLPLE
jgi:hypothetical protein